ncbi:terminase large subunit [Arthrobacter phage MargaretKali]|uniref:Terminase n=1 Tax=Arthrobacter phage MargaretKali TaxID=2250414 RepID=A0A345KN52_9CAUD|nr:terminase large subunit [Arthrobacter phage MargaretKali]AXH44454.1 terminase [Arthrobacter phage MargaretKali]
MVIPSGIVSTAWPSVAKKAGEIGLGVDDWQEGIGRLALAKREDGKFAAGIGGVVLSIPRQVGKTYLVALIIFCLCLLNPGLTVLWTAHRMKTAGETFAKLQAFTRKKKIAPHVAKVTTGAGDEVIYFTNGSRIMFGARERGFGRGFDNVDVEVFDEAQILTEAAVEDMVPATNVAPNPLLFFIGTPPRPKDPGEIFKGKRREALSGEDEDTVYVEFSADPGASENDRKQWRKANPSYPHRTDDAAMLRMKKALNTPGSFRREAMGIWDNETSVTIFENWNECRRDERPAGLELQALAVAVSYDLKHSAIAAASLDDAGVWVKDLHYTAGTAGLIERCKALQDVYDVDIVIDGRGPGAFLIPEFSKAGVRLHEATTGEALDAFANLDARVEAGTFLFVDTKQIEDAAASAAKRDVVKRSALGRKTPESNISTLEAAMFAAWRACSPPEPKKSAYEDEDLMVV